MHTKIEIPSSLPVSILKEKLWKVILKHERALFFNFWALFLKMFTF